MHLKFETTVPHREHRWCADRSTTEPNLTSIDFVHHRAIAMTAMVSIANLLAHCYIHIWLYRRALRFHVSGRSPH